LEWYRKLFLLFDQLADALDMLDKLPDLGIEIIAKLFRSGTISVEAFCLQIA